MKTMKNFAAQQLSKTQMNEVKGGVVTMLCPLYRNGELINYVYASGADVIEAGNKINEQIPKGTKTGKCDIS